MNKIILTCPFTGIEFDAGQFNDGKLICVNPLTNQVFEFDYDVRKRTFTINAELFNRVRTCTQAQAMEILGITRQRVNAIVKNQTIPVHRVNDKDVFLLSDVLEYKQARKVGKPVRRTDNGTGDHQRDR